MASSGTSDFIGEHWHQCHCCSLGSVSLCPQRVCVRPPRISFVPTSPPVSVHPPVSPCHLPCVLFMCLHVTSLMSPLSCLLHVPMGVPGVPKATATMQGGGGGGVLCSHGEVQCLQGHRDGPRGSWCPQGQHSHAEGSPPPCPLHLPCVPMVCPCPRMSLCPHAPPKSRGGGSLWSPTPSGR